MHFEVLSFVCDYEEAARFGINKRSMDDTDRLIMVFQLHAWPSYSHLRGLQLFPF